MGMKFELEHRCDADLDAVMAMLADSDFAQTRGRASGAARADAVVDTHDDGGFTVAIRRTIPADSIPPEIRSVVGSSLDVKYTEAWDQPDGDSALGTFALDITGAPGRVTGTMEAHAESGGTVLRAHGDATVPVPLFGHLIEKAIVEAVETAFVAEFGAADAWLEQRR